MNTIKTNSRFDRLTNLDISTHYRNIEFYAFPHDFLAAFAYWVVLQNLNRTPINLAPALLGFKDYLAKFFTSGVVPEKFTYGRLQEVINDDVFESINPILDLNKLKPDFIDLGALARNVFFMILREHITQD